MRAARAIWGFLSHPALSAAGNFSLLFTYGPLAVAVLAAFAGIVIASVQGGRVGYRTAPLGLI
jgi:hypothetical protein